MCLVGFVIIFILGLIAVAPEKTAEKTAEVIVRSVLISCEPENGQSVPYDNEAMRFEREELFKHSVLRDCLKKIALTVKIASDPDNSGDEYIPIEHVFQGPKKRVRLLNPYILRLRREPPLQAYKLRKIDTVTGTLAEEMANRIKRSIEPDEVQNEQKNMQHRNTSRELSMNSESCGEIKSGLRNNLCLTREKRNENNIPNVEKPNSIDKTHSGLNVDDNEPMRTFDKSISHAIDENMPERSINLNDISESIDEIRLEDWKPVLNEAVLLKAKKPKEPQPYEVKTKIDWDAVPNSDKQVNSKKQKSVKMVDNTGKEYDMYEIGNADLWYTIQVQLFEKLTNGEGKTVWNDLTKGKPARVSSLSPEWSDQDISIRYRSSEWIPRTQFTLPMTNMCLLAPVINKASTPVKNPITDQYIVVPREDVVGLSVDMSGTNKRDGNSNREQNAEKGNDQTLRRVMIRTTRALFSGVGDKVTILSQGPNEFLTLVHRKPYHAQIDLEARADANQLVHVGTFGRIMTVVADNSRRTRTVLTVQATNTGLAAARFRVVARDCNPELPELMNDKVNEADDSILLPPKHTQSIRLDVPVEIPVDVAHCSVSLINGEDQTVAVRDVTIKKGDRCFCVWHCECVCLGEDPKLLCREMPEARQVAAGLSLRERTRHVRSVCYHDVVSINLCITILGVLIALLIFGLLKACLGLFFRCVGRWGLHHILQMPRRLDHYYETSLQERKVVYDDEGWPVHPDTKKRSVRLISRSMEFILNTIFFITAPCIITYEALRHLLSRCKKTDDGSAGAGGSNWDAVTNTKNCFSSHDIQGNRARLRRRRAKLQRWMSPEAETLSSNLWQKGLPVRSSMIKEYMRPLLHEECCRGDIADHDPINSRLQEESCGDSEVDDTEYVLMQMQKSRESLARSQRKLNGPVTTMTSKMQ